MSEWDAHAADWDTDPGPRAYAAAAFASLLEVVDRHGVVLRDARVCDFGCGTGLLTERLVDAGATVDAVDTSTAMLDVVRSKIEAGGWEGVRALTDRPDDAIYDLAVCSSVLAFVDDHPGTVASIASSLRHGAAFVQWDWERSDDRDDHGLTRDEVRDALVAAGLVDVEVGPAFEIEVEELVMRPLLGHGRRPDPGVTDDPGEAPPRREPPPRSGRPDPS